MEEKLFNKSSSFCSEHYPSRLRGRKLSWLFSSLPSSLLSVLLSSHTSRIPENRGLGNMIWTRAEKEQVTDLKAKQMAETGYVTLPSK